jgi:bacterioferritin-associated ferredoxin
MEDLGPAGKFGVRAQGCANRSLVPEYQEAKIRAPAQSKCGAWNDYARTMIAAHRVECDPNFVCHGVFRSSRLTATRASSQCGVRAAADNSVLRDEGKLSAQNREDY